MLSEYKQIKDVSDSLVIRKISPRSIAEFEKRLSQKPMIARQMMIENDAKQREQSRMKPRNYDKDLIAQRQGRGARSM